MKRDLLEDLNDIITTKELREIGISHYQIKCLIKEGILERIRRGVYINPNSLDGNDYDIILKLIPNGVFCLGSAALIYDYSTDIPLQYHVAIPKENHITLPAFPPVKLYYWNKRQVSTGLIEIENNGREIKIFDKEKTVCDFIKFRNKLDKNVVKQVIKSYLADKERNLVKLKKYAIILNISTVLDNYLDILL